MAVDLEAPRRIGRRRSKNADPVKKLAELVGQSGELGQMLVEPHGIARRLVGPRAKCYPHDAVGEIELAIAQFGKTQPMPHHIAVDITPVPPHLAVYREAHRRALRRIERGQKCVDRSDQRLCRGAGRAQRERFGSTSPDAVRPLNACSSDCRQVANRSCSGCESVLSSTRGGARRDGRSSNVVSVIERLLARTEEPLKIGSTLRGNCPLLCEISCIARCGTRPAGGNGQCTVARTYFASTDAPQNGAIEGDTP